MDKRKLNLSTLMCPAGVDCFEIDPSHFITNCHPLLNSMVDVGIDAETGEYQLTEEAILAAKKRIQQQLQIIASHGRDNDENPSKKLRTSERFEVKIDEAGKTQQSKFTSQTLSDFFKKRSSTFKALQQATTSSSITANNFPSIPSTLKEFFPVVHQQGQMAEKLRKASPYNLFLTTITSSAATHNDSSSITFLDILDPSLGELESSVQINFIVDINWLLAQYAATKINHLPLLILYGEEDRNLKHINGLFKNVNSKEVKIKTDYGSHHTKMMLLFYRDESMRVVVSTANLFHEDWNNRVQGVWISDRLEKANFDNHKDDSETNFRSELIEYLENYDDEDMILEDYMDRIKSCNFSSVNVFLITSIPGKHEYPPYGHEKLGELLKRYSAPIDATVPITIQCSSIGNYGDRVSEYLHGEISESFSSHSAIHKVNASAVVKIIYPSLRNVKNSHDGMLAGAGLPYHKNQHKNQPWLNKFLYQWKSTSRDRDRAMPHIKTYCRHSNEGLFWFVLTSANMSKSAWGTKSKKLRISSYELGIVFFPRVILKGKNVFPMNQEQQEDDTPIFKLPFDVPLVPYEPTDKPFCIEDMTNYH